MLFLKRKISCVAIASAAALAGLSGAGAAESQQVSYKGETIDVIVRSSAGGGYDSYGRLVSRHMSRHIPGNPESIVKNMPGAGGIVAANYMARQAKRDGTQIAVLGRDIAIAQRVGARGVAYDVTKLIPIGSAATEVWVWVARSDLPIKDLAGLKNYGKTVKFSGTGAGSGSVQKVRFLANEGLPVKVITGYDGRQEKVLAILRGEVDATSGSYSSLDQLIRDEGLKVLGRIGKHPDLASVPDAREWLSDKGKALAELMAASQLAGRPFLTAPQVPDARVKVLRTAFRQALEDPRLLEEAKRAKLSISYVSGEEMEEAFGSILGASDAAVEEFEKLM